MMALHVGLAPRRRRRPPSSAIPACFVLPDKAKPDAVAGEIKSRPPVLLIHGDQDELIPAQALFQAAQALAALDVPVEWHMSPGIGHGIDQEGLRHGGEFLARRFGLRPSRRCGTPSPRFAHNLTSRASQSRHAPYRLCVPPLRRAAIGGVGGASP